MTITPPPLPPEIAAQPLETLEGVVERLTFADPESHYAVLRLKVKGARHPTTVVGALAAVSEGEQLHLKGKYEIHPKYGEQFRAVWWYSVLPATVAGIKKYLASGLVKGIGPEMAQRLVARFGAQTLEIIENHRERLLEVPGLGPKRLAQIEGAWQGQKEIREIMVSLQGLGVSLGLATKIYQTYKSQAVEVLTTNPYQLALDIQGLGFLTADRLASRLNLDPLAPARLAAGLLHVLDTFAGEGHVYAPQEDLLQKTQELLRVAVEPLAGALHRLAQEGRIVIDQEVEGTGVYK
ncbi:MAG: ATP-dependent RecD-like DNA helicase, partial [Syntrophales bacterium]|nr:ATP-dependent RecD-like DNA helicase [Syntrophales bacterium]